MLYKHDGERVDVSFVDIDGTLLEPEQLITNLKTSASIAGLSHDPVDRFFKDVWKGTQKFHSNLERGIKDGWGIEDAILAARFRQSFIKLETTTMYKPIPGAKETIQWFKSHGVIVVPLTANPFYAYRMKLTLAGWDPSEFPIAGTADDRFVKPNPQSIFHLLLRVGVLPRNAVHVGDSDADFEVTRMILPNGTLVQFVDFFAVLSGVSGPIAFEKMGVRKEAMLPSIADLRSVFEER